MNVNVARSVYTRTVRTKREEKGPKYCHCAEEIANELVIEGHPRPLFSSCK